MDNEKIAHILYKIHSDDLKDAEMLYDYAEDVREAGDMAIASALCSRAKVRLNQMQETERSIESVLQRIVSNGERSTISEMYEELYKKHMEHTAEHLREKLNEM